MKKQFITKQFVATLCILAVVGVAVGVGVEAGNEVECTVTPKLVSIGVSPPSVGYGFVDVPSTDNIPTTPSSDPIIAATNSGNVDEDFTIRGDDATGTSITWTIVDGSPGTYDYNHKFLDCGNDSGCSSPAAANNLTKTTESLAEDVSAGSSEYFKLKLSTPTETGNDTSQHSTSVTVIAIAS
ncbi:hypothetical protein KAT63_01570 [Candidatus Parcubacteria bacterium]|nr:hypothetical protein [Candidatus Parcubacteria bacterium]